MYSFALYLLYVVGTTVVMAIIEVLQMGEVVMDDVILSSCNRHIYLESVVVIHISVSSGGHQHIQLAVIDII